METVFVIGLDCPDRVKDDGYTALALPALPYGLRDVLEMCLCEDSGQGGETDLFAQAFAPEVSFFFTHMLMELSDIPMCFPLPVETHSREMPPAGWLRAFAVEMARWYVLREISGCAAVLKGVRSVEHSKAMPAQEPDYAVVLEIRQGEHTAVVKLPVSSAQLHRALDEAGVTDGPESMLRCVECRVPLLREVLSSSGSASRINRAAWLLKYLPDEWIPLYQELLCAHGFTTLQEALDVMKHLDESVISPEEAARNKMAGHVRKVNMARRNVSPRNCGTCMTDHAAGLTGCGGTGRKSGVLPRRQSNDTPGGKASSEASKQEEPGEQQTAADSEEQHASGRRVVT